MKQGMKAFPRLAQPCRMVYTAPLALGLLAATLPGPAAAQNLAYTSTELVFPSWATTCVRPRINAAGDVLAECGYKKSVPRGPAAPPSQNFLAGLFQGPRTVSVTFYRLVMWPAGQGAVSKVLPDPFVPAVDGDFFSVMGFNQAGEVLVVSRTNPLQLLRHGQWQNVMEGASVSPIVGAALNEAGTIAGNVDNGQGYGIALQARGATAPVANGPWLLGRDGVAIAVFRGAFNNLNQWAMAASTVCKTLNGCTGPDGFSVFWDGGVLHTLPYLTGIGKFEPEALNVHGQMAGRVIGTNGPELLYAPTLYAYDGVGYTRIGPGYGPVINAAGMVAAAQPHVVRSGGQYTQGTPATLPFTWRNGVSTLLQAQVSLPSSQRLRGQPSLNDKGQIAVEAHDSWRSKGRLHVLTPR